MFTVYRVTSPSGKVYIGITKKGLARRKIQHLSLAKHGNDYNFHRAIRKYGDSLVWEEVETGLDRNSAIALEQQLIKHHDSYKKGYNMTLGGDGQWGLKLVHSDESKQKISQNNARYWLGRPRSEETKKKLSISQIGTKRPPVSEATREKLRRVTRRGPNHEFFGKKPHNYKCGDLLKFCSCGVSVNKRATRCRPCAQVNRWKNQRMAA